MYKIIVRTLNGKILTYSVNSYNIEHGFVVFLDKVKGETKRYATNNCEINEVG